MSDDLSEPQNFLLGTGAAFVAGVTLQPTLYWKNAAAQSLPFTLNPRLLYRGTGTSLMNECLQMGVQFGITGFVSKLLANNFVKKNFKLNKNKEEIISSFSGGFFASPFVAPVELIMIQQQKHGKSILATASKIVTEYGIFSQGFMRGILPCGLRDSIYVLGMLGVTPIINKKLIEDYQMNPTTSLLISSSLGGILSALPSQPFDVLKTCIQGDIENKRFSSSMFKTANILYKENGLKRFYYGSLMRSVNIIFTVYIVNQFTSFFKPYVKKIQI